MTVRRAESRKCQLSQISQRQRDSESVGWVFEIWRQFWRRTPDLFYFRYSPFSHFLWQLRWNTFPPHARRSNTTKYLSWGFFWTSSSCSKVTTQSDLQNCYSYFSYNPSRAQKAPHSCFEASKEHSCISSVSALPATVYVASGVCRGRQ